MRTITWLVAEREADRVGVNQAGERYVDQYPYKIHLNFLPFADGLPRFRVFRRPVQPTEERPNGGTIRQYSLPCDPSNPEARRSYWVSIDERDGYEPVFVGPNDNNHLTEWVLFRALLATVNNSKHRQRVRVRERKFGDEIRFVMNSHPEGDEELVLQPYFLRSHRQFGFLADFHFRLGEGVPYSRRVQQLSLALDENYKRNLDYYNDRVNKITSFLKTIEDSISPIQLPGTETGVSLHFRFQSLEATRLRSKVYVFAGERESRSQFLGLKEYGPLENLKSPVSLLFVFREQDRRAARELAAVLQGSHRAIKMPGFAQLFRTPLVIDRNPVVVDDFSEHSASRVLERVSFSPIQTVPIFLLPDSHDPGYFQHKALFAERSIPTQVCTLQTLSSQDALRWSAANIALQIFCKAGGLPWKVRSTGERSLIIGISQSHKTQRVGTETRIERYFAFSVLTDNSGMFQKIQVLGDARDRETYLSDLKRKLRETLINNTEEFSRIVIHTSYRLKWSEIDAIRQVVSDMLAEGQRRDRQFAVIKVNEHNRFFGTNANVNSLVPYEGTSVRLGYNEFLIWFEGLYPDNPTVKKAFPGPTHVEFLRLRENERIDMPAMLQDLVNLAGANWRGFNAKGSPVSVFYCHLVANLVLEFHQRGLPAPAVDQMKPWFL